MTRKWEAPIYDMGSGTFVRHGSERAASKPNATATACGSDKKGGRCFSNGARYSQLGRKVSPN